MVELARDCKGGGGMQKREFQHFRSPEVVIPLHYDRNPHGSNLFGRDPTGKADSPT